MDKKILSTDNAPQAIGPYSQAVEADGWIFISGQIPLDPKTGTMTGEGVGAQTRRVLDNIGGILAARGLDFRNVVKTTIYLTDMANFGAMNEVYATYFPENPPARATVGVHSLPKGAAVEIDAIARV
jgi:2-iminobutanoate/2-iminopropanoate deaminase